MVGWVGRWMERRKGERDAGKKAGRLAEMLEKHTPELRPDAAERVNEY